MGEDEGTTQKTKAEGLEALLENMRGEGASEATIAAVRALATARSIPVSSDSESADVKTEDILVEAPAPKQGGNGKHPEPAPPPEPPPQPEPEEPVREQRLDRDCVLEARPDLFAGCKNDYGRRCKASTMVTEMSGSKGLQEQPTGYRNTRRWHYADDETRTAAIKSWLEDKHPKDKPKPPEPASKFPSLKQIIEQESEKMEGVPELPGWKITDLAREWREIKKVSKHLNPTGEGKSRRYPLKNVEAEAPAREAVRELVYDLRTDLAVTMDYVESEFSGVFRDCENDREDNALKKEVEAAIYEDGSVAEQEMEFHGTTRHIKNDDEATKTRIEDIIWEKYLKDMPEKPEDDEGNGEDEPPPAPKLPRGVQWVLDNFSEFYAGMEAEEAVQHAEEILEGAAEAGYLPRARSLKRASTLDFDSKPKAHEGLTEFIDENYHPNGEKKEEADVPEPDEEPPEPVREQRLDRDYVLEARPDLFESCSSENANKCRASTFVTKMSGTKGLKEQAESYRTTKRWHYADDEKRTAAIDRWLEKKHPETEPEPAKRKPPYRPTPRSTPPTAPASAAPASYPAVRSPAAPAPTRKRDAGYAPRTVSAGVVDAARADLMRVRRGKAAPAKSEADKFAEKEKEARKAGVPQTVIDNTSRLFTLDSIAALYTEHKSDMEDLTRIFSNFNARDYEMCAANLNGQSLPSAHPAYHCLPSSASNFERGRAYLLSQVKIKRERESMSPMERRIARNDRMKGGF